MNNPLSFLFAAMLLLMCIATAAVECQGVMEDCRSNCNLYMSHCSLVHHKKQSDSLPGQCSYAFTGPCRVINITNTARTYVDCIHQCEVLTVCYRCKHVFHVYTMCGYVLIGANTFIGSLVLIVRWALTNKQTSKAKNRNLDYYFASMFRLLGLFTVLMWFINYLTYHNGTLDNCSSIRPTCKHAAIGISGGLVLVDILLGSRYAFSAKQDGRINSVTYAVPAENDEVPRAIS
jgi:hypothetical protein